MSNLPLSFLLHLFLLPHLLRAAPRPPFSLFVPSSSTSAPQCHRRRRLCPSSEPHRVLPPPSSLPLRATPWPSRATIGMATVAAAVGAARPPRLPPRVHRGMATVAAAAGAARPPRLPPRVHRTRVDRAYTRQSHPPSLDLFIPHAPCQSCGAIDGLHVKLATRLSPPLLHPYKERP